MNIKDLEQLRRLRDLRAQEALRLMQDGARQHARAGADAAHAAQMLARSRQVLAETWAQSPLGHELDQTARADMEDLLTLRKGQVQFALQDHVAKEGKRSAAAAKLVDLTKASTMARNALERWDRVLETTRDEIVRGQERLAEYDNEFTTIRPRSKDN
jgi:hypothetical protein